jgi:hypothetical protein
VLIVLSGTETIHKRFLGRKIFAALNQKVVDGYSYSYQNDVLEIFDNQGNLVFRPFSNFGKKPSFYIKSEDDLIYDDTDNLSPINDLLINRDDGSANESGRKIVDEFSTFEENDIIQYAHENYFGNRFVDADYDLGTSNDELPIFLLPEFETHGYHMFPTYENLIENYKNRVYENHVVTGAFGKYIIDKLRSDLGEDNVKVINITRNPSVAKVLHEKPEGYYELAKNPHLNAYNDRGKLLDSLLVNTILSKLNYVQTIKFEDILVNGYFELLGKKVYLPRPYVNFNNLITTYENENLISLNLSSQETITEFNNYLSEFDSDFWEIESSLSSLYPSNVFQELNYSPLTYDEIVSK